MCTQLHLVKCTYCKMSHSNCTECTKIVTCYDIRNSNTEQPSANIMILILCHTTAVDN